MITPRFPQALSSDGTRPEPSPRAGSGRAFDRALADLMGGSDEDIPTQEDLAGVQAALAAVDLVAQRIIDAGPYLTLDAFDPQTLNVLADEPGVSEPANVVAAPPATQDAASTLFASAEIDVSDPVVTLEPKELSRWHRRIQPTLGDAGALTAPRQERKSKDSGTPPSRNSTDDPSTNSPGRVFLANEFPVVPIPAPPAPPRMSERPSRRRARSELPEPSEPSALPKKVSPRSAATPRPEPVAQSMDGQSFDERPLSVAVESREPVLTSTAKAVSASASPPRDSAVPQGLVPPEQVPERIRVALERGKREVRIRLDPPELGTIDVKIAVDGTDVRLTVRTEHAEASQLVQQSLHDLRARLNQSGLTLADADIDVDLGSSGQHGGQRQPSEHRDAPEGDLPSASNTDRQTQDKAVRAIA